MERAGQYSPAPWGAFALPVFVAAALICTLFLGLLPAHLAVNDNGDYIAFYEPVARNILSGRGPVSDSGRPAIRYPPGFPVILAGLFATADAAHAPRTAAVAAFNVVCVGVCAVLIFTIARQFWRPVPALGAAFVWMTYPFVLWLAKEPTSELPFMVLFYGAFLSLWKSRLRRG